MPLGAGEFRRYVDLWLELEKSRGVRERDLKYWIRGEPRPESKKRWNLIDNAFP
jgi:hypothetical protein